MGSICASLSEAGRNVWWEARAAAGLPERSVRRRPNCATTRAGVCSEGLSGIALILHDARRRAGPGGPPPTPWRGGRQTHREDQQQPARGIESAHGGRRCFGDGIAVRHHGYLMCHCSTVGTWRLPARLGAGGIDLLMWMGRHRYLWQKGRWHNPGTSPELCAVSVGIAGIPNQSPPKRQRTPSRRVMASFRPLPIRRGDPTPPRSGALRSRSRE